MYLTAALLAIVAVQASPAAPQASSYFDGYETVDSPSQPVQIRMSYQGPSAMLISWNTFEHLKRPTVKYGTKAGHLVNKASSTDSYTYNTSLTYNNHVNLTNLKPSTRYFYLPQGGNFTKPFSFVTGKSAGDQTPFNVAVVVDMGTFGPLGLGSTTGTGATSPVITPGEHTTIQTIAGQLSQYDFVVHPGDLSYADAWLKEEIQNYLPNTSTYMYPTVYEHINNAFYDELMNITAYKPYMVSPGNHESNCDNGGTTNKATGQVYTEAICSPGQTNFTGYINRFRMPSGPSGGQGNFWYSYDHGMAHFVHIDTETDLGANLTGPDQGSPEFSGNFGYPNEQINWLQNDLANVNRTATPWVIALGHRPLYNSAGGICANCTAAFEDIFHQYGVDLYFCGHSHVYCRNNPIYQNVSDPNGLNNPSSTWYIVNGAAGHYDGLDSLNYPLMNYTAYAQDSAYSFSRLLFHNCSHLTQEAVYSGNGSVYDTATLIKDRTC